MVSPVGYTAQQTCAALRAGIVRFCELPDVVSGDGGPTITARIPPGFAPANRPAERLRQIAQHTLRQALAPRDPTGTSRPLGLSVVLRDGETLSSESFLALQSVLSDIGRSAPTRMHVYPQGSAGGMIAVLDAQERLADDPRAIELVWGIDSLHDIPTLLRLEQSARLKGRSQPRGLIPGEASACVALEDLRCAQTEGSKVYCTVAGLGIAKEPAPVLSELPCLGKGLTDCIRDALRMARWSQMDIGQVYCDLNGEAYRAHEWMLARCRTLDSPEVLHCADCIGDIGAASMPLLLGVAAIAWARGYARSERCLVFCSSEQGTRGALCVQNACRDSRSR